MGNIFTHIRVLRSHIHHKVTFVCSNGMQFCHVSSDISSNIPLVLSELLDKITPKETYFLQ